MPDGQVSLADLPYIGSKSKRVLVNIGIVSAEQIIKPGSVAIYAQAKNSGAKGSPDLLWALEAAATGLR